MWSAPSHGKKKAVKVPIRDEAKQILKKYDKGSATGFVFPRVSNVKANEYIKEVAKLCGMNEILAVSRYSGVERIDSVEAKYLKISMHTARRTFVTLSLEKGMRPEVVKVLLVMKIIRP